MSFYVCCYCLVASLKHTRKILRTTGKKANSNERCGSPSPACAGRCPYLPLPEDGALADEDSEAAPPGPPLGWSPSPLGWAGSPGAGGEAGEALGMRWREHSRSSQARLVHAGVRSASPAMSPPNAFVPLVPWGDTRPVGVSCIPPL